jgi:NADPH:quinone reductase-like Zn-dependent oxidoreductase
MKAFMVDRPVKLDALHLVEIAIPAVPDERVLVWIHAASVNPVDLFPLSTAAYIGRAMGSGFRPKPIVIGTDFAGTVESVGKGVTKFQPGDEVFGGRDGAFAEYVSVRETGAIARKPANVTFEEAAAVPVSATTALQGLRDHGRIASGQRVLINGASGGVGTYAVQIAKSFGTDVTAVCSTGNVECVRSLGADRVIDYTKEDFIQAGETYDLIFDVAGSRSWSKYKRIMKPAANYVAVGVAAHQYGPGGSGKALGHYANVRLASIGGSRRATSFIAKLKQDDLLVLAELLAAGKVRSVIDRRYPLAEVPAALRYLNEGHSKGKIVIDI